MAYYTSDHIERYWFITFCEILFIAGSFRCLLCQISDGYLDQFFSHEILAAPLSLSEGGCRPVVLLYNNSKWCKWATVSRCYFVLLMYNTMYNEPLEAPHKTLCSTWWCHILGYEHHIDHWVLLSDITCGLSVTSQNRPEGLSSYFVH